MTTTHPIAVNTYVASNEPGKALKFVLDAPFINRPFPPSNARSLRGNVHGPVDRMIDALTCPEGVYDVTAEDPQRIRISLRHGRRWDDADTCTTHKGIVTTREHVAMILTDELTRLTRHHFELHDFMQTPLNRSNLAGV